MPGDTCKLCGGPIRARSKYGYCSRNPECRRAKASEYRKLYGDVNREEKREKKRAYDRQYRADNRDKKREYGRQYYAENRDRIQERNRNWNAENQEQVREYKKEYYAQNRDRRQAYLKEWREANRESILERVREWQKANPDKRREHVRNNSQKRRALKLGTQVGELPVYLLGYLLERDGDGCGICGERVDINDAHVDHIIPLSKDGWHIKENLQLAHPSCNFRKNSSISPGDMSNFIRNATNAWRRRLGIDDE